MRCCETRLNSNCCNITCGCGEQNDNVKKKKIVIDFMYLDLNVCERCKGTEGSLEEAVSDVAKVLELTGAEVVVNKIHIDSEEKAIQYRFKSSPTIRINGKDVQLEVRESLCESCGDLCGDEVDCRVWVYNGKEYTVPPKAMIIDAILKEVYGGNSSSDIDRNKEEAYELPENLKRFFKAMREKGKR
ncbi:hypothetical protein JOD02_001653 [Caldicoprobacter guelmensis]|uniref:DUF2703 domain-containing protein n=1 Tax=Caldicoprobacter guelmensis TaxID=1170224 RepID=UPI00195AED39|nr:DUF2703 domain-containing protein [Caldicoprobacter guelmensis]MBM7582784.1 hypothetical protein [Caldicoprobacter guelmensis]